MRKKRFCLLVLITLLFFDISVKAYEFENPDNEKLVNDKIKEIYSSKKQYEDLMGNVFEEDEISIYKSSSTAFWWPIGSLETTEINGKLFAIGAPQYTYISSVFGAKEKGLRDNSPSGHGAIDIPGDLGVTNVIAAQSGVVTGVVDGYKDDHYSADAAYMNQANYVIIQHDNGITTKYWHLAKNSITVSVGERVEQGQVIGKVGSSGYSTGPHLHFQVEDASGTKVNPINYVDPENPRPTDSGSDRLIALLNFLEGYTPDSNGYFTVEDIGDGVRTVGAGVTLENNPERFEKYGINIDQYPVGSKISVDIVDQIRNDIVHDLKENIKADLANNSITLNDDQLNALVIRTYQMGNYNRFISNYKKYGATLDLYTNWWFNAVPGSKFYEGMKNRRNNEWKLFYEGIYVNEQ